MPALFDAEHIPPGMHVDLYISTDCPYCAQAMAYYDRVRTRYTVHDAQNNREERAKMFAHSGGDPTVPAIVVEGKYLQSGWGKPPRG